MLKRIYLKYESFKTNIIVFNVTTVFTVTFDQFTVSVMNKIKTNILRDPISVYIKYTRQLII